MTESSQDESHRMRWQLGEGQDPGLLAPLLAEDALTLELDPPQRTTLELFDDFERHVTHAGRALIREEGRLRLVDGFDLRSSPIEGGRRRGQKPVLADAFGPGAFHDALRGHLKLRGAVPLVSVERTAREGRVRNLDGKVVVRLLAQQLSIDGSFANASLVLAPLVGYGEEARAVADRIHRSAQLELDPCPTAHRILEAAGLDAVPPSHKSPVPLRPEQSAHEAVTAVARHLLRVARQAEPGIQGDVDTEFVHDYRVAIRKLRSVLRSLKDVYLEEDAARLRSRLAEYARATNRLRDLDVHLLDESRYRAELPSALRAGLDRLFSDLKQQRGEELARVKRRLRSVSYRKGIEELEAWLQQTEVPRGPAGGAPVGEVVAREVQRSYARIRKRGRRIDRHTPDSDVHRVRIECKRLRYLLEIFSSVLPAADHKKVVRRLEALQDGLGRHNDCATQQKAMLDYLRSARSLGATSAAAVGGLIALLGRQQVEAREDALAQLERFDADATRSIVLHMCADPPESEV